MTAAMSSSEEDIEMIGLTKEDPRPEEEVEDDESSDGEDGSEEPGPGLWPQVKSIVIQSAPSLLLTTTSLLFSGELLDKVSRWQAMRQVHQLIMVIPAVLNLKGNLEMNLSARLGTAANVGQLNDPSIRRSLILGNLTLLQVQATAVSFIVACSASLIAFFFPALFPEPDPTPGLSTFIMVASTAVASACLSSVVLGSFMSLLVLLCLHFSLDPDNIAPPIASCLGDLVTLLFIGLTSTLLIPFLSSPPHHLIPLFPFSLLILLLLSATIALLYTIRNPHVRPLLSQGWSPLFGAMLISTGTGIVLEQFVSRYEGFALLAVVISGLPGAVGSILVSRLSTSAHLDAQYAIIPSTQHPPPKPKPRKEPSTRLVILTLLLVTIPIEVAFLGVIRALGWLHLPMLFVVFSIVFFFCAVTISLVVARVLTAYLWSRGRDPDMYALPIHSALMDLVGQLMLVVCFEIAQALGAKVSMMPPGGGGGSGVPGIA